jgi:hypothetical protein
MQGAVSALLSIKVPDAADKASRVWAFESVTSCEAALVEMVAARPVSV